MLPTAGTADPIEQQTVEDIANGRVKQQMVDDGGEGLRLWDNLENAWTSPLPASQAQLYCKKAVFRCPACNWTSTHPGDVARHISEASEKTAKHQRARLKLEMLSGQSWETCTGCGSHFRVGKPTGRTHLEQMRGMGASHKGASEEVVLRFSLAPPGTPTLPRGTATAPPSSASVRGRGR